MRTNAMQPFSSTFHEGAAHECELTSGPATASSSRQAARQDRRASAGTVSAALLYAHHVQVERFNKAVPLAPGSQTEAAKALITEREGGTVWSRDCSIRARSHSNESFAKVLVLGVR